MPKKLSMCIDYSGDEPRVTIDGTNYARNIVGDGVVIERTTPGLVQDTVTVTVSFVVDDLRVVSSAAK